jgi:dTDP-4-amino-4,6-dideoxygalactose transaminase
MFGHGCAGSGVLGGRSRATLAERARVDHGDEHAWHLFPLRIDGPPRRDAFIEAMTAAGIGTSVHFIPLHRQPYYRDRYGLLPGDLPNATAWGEQEVSLPIFPSMRDEQVARVIAAVPAALAHT